MSGYLKGSFLPKRLMLDIFIPFSELSTPRLYIFRKRKKGIILSQTDFSAVNTVHDYTTHNRDEALGMTDMATYSSSP